MRTFPLTLVTLSVAALAGATPLHAVQRRSNVLTAEEIERAKPNGGSAFEIVETLRPRWLQVRELSRLPGTAGEPLKSTPVYVYVNDVNMGSVDYLKTIPAETVLEMRWLSANETAGRYGPTDGQAAIVVKLKR
ncbi:MAG TPA: hypothetical protein VEK85_00510 [Gemmatimonadales bacterium]|nr:hypothetical protein [Gemmatimonadales bacterium]